MKLLSSHIVIKNKAKTKKTEYNAIQLQLSAVSRNRVRNETVLYPGRTTTFGNFVYTLMTPVECWNNSVPSFVLQSCSFSSFFCTQCCSSTILNIRHYRQEWLLGAIILGKHICHRSFMDLPIHRSSTSNNNTLNTRSFRQRVKNWPRSAAFLATNFRLISDCLNSSHLSMNNR